MRACLVVLFLHPARPLPTRPRHGAWSLRHEASAMRRASPEHDTRLRHAPCGTARLSMIVLAVDLTLSSPTAALPPPPSKAQQARWADCMTNFAPGSTPLTVTLGDAPKAPAELNPEWSAEITSSRDVGHVVSLSWLWSRQAPSPSGPSLLAATDKGFWLLIPAQSGRYNPRDPAIAFPMRDVQGAPTSAQELGMAIVVQVPSRSELVSYDSFHCAGSSAPVSRVSYAPLGAVRRIDRIGHEIELVFQSRQQWRKLTYPPVGDELPALEIGKSVAVHPTPDVVSLSDFPLAKGCDRFEVSRDSSSPESAVLISTFCSSDFRKVEREMERSASKRHRSPRAILSRRLVGRLNEPIIAIAAGLPDWSGMEVSKPVPFNDHSRPGVPAWLYMVAQDRSGGPIKLLAFKPYRADYPKALGGVDPPPPSAG